MLRIATGFFCVICVTITAYILMDAAKISHARMVESRSSALHPTRDAYNGQQTIKLNGYTWVDKKEKGVSIPVDRAMDVVAAELGGNTWAPVLPKPFSLEDLGITNDGLMTFSADAANAGSGKAIFDANCVGCHGSNAAGLSGANLTDGYWLHGAEPTDIFTTVYKGVGAKGMPSWGGQLGDQVKDVVAFILSVKDTNLAGKEPQGVDVEGNAP